MAQDFTKTEAIVADIRHYLHSDPDFDHELHQSAAVESLDHYAVNIAVRCHTSPAATREFSAHRADVSVVIPCADARLSK